MSAHVQLPPEGQINPMNIYGFKYRKDENNMEWIGLAQIARHFITPERLHFNLTHVREMKLKLIIGEEHIRAFEQSSRTGRVWYISEKGLALLVRSRLTQIGMRYLSVPGKQALDRLSDWAESVLNEGPERGGRE